MISKNINNEIKEIRLATDKLICNLFDKKIKQAHKNYPTLIPVLKKLKIFCSKGKRLRVILAYFVYSACDGQRKKEFLKIVVSLELIHNFLLIHDDIVDRDELRRGNPTLHVALQKIYKDEHLGKSLAIFSGNLLQTMGYEIIHNAKITPQKKNRIINLFNATINDVCSGEILDIVLPTKNVVSTEETLLMNKYKTASYTVRLPVLLAALMADASFKQTNQLNKFSQPLGIAFQIRDDILDLFGNQNKIGKKVGSDIYEGKKTLLILKTIELLNKQDKIYFKKILQKRSFKAVEFKKIKKLIIKSGALEFCQDLCQKYKEQSLSQLRKNDFDNDINKLIKISDYLINRNK